MEGRRIGFDIDGVLADFTNSYIELFPNIEFPTEDPTFPDRWHFEAHHGASTADIDKAWRFIEDPENQFWAGLRPLVTDWERMRIVDLARHNSVFYITSRGGPDVQAQTNTWLWEQGFPIGAAIPTKEDKGPIAAALNLDFLIDDRVQNIESTLEKAPRTNCYLRKSTHNFRDHWPCPAVDSVNEFLDRIGAP